MITETQINLLKKAIIDGTTDLLITTWENELFLKHKEKGGIAFDLINQQNKTIKTVKGISVLNGLYCFHKDAYGGSFYVLSHVKTGVKVLSGKKQPCTEALRKFEQWKYANKMDDLLNEHSMQALRHADDTLVTEYRAMYEKALGR